MVIEGAFYKLPDYFLSEETPQLSYEGQLISYFTLAIFLELQNRGIANPFLNIQLEKRYSKVNPKAKNKWVDIFVDVPWLESSSSESKKALTANYYHIFRENWVEVKFFGGIERAEEREKRGGKKGAETTTENVGSILGDLLRLKSYLPLNCGKYFLVGFNRSPKKYLAFRKRDYLKQLFKPGTHEIEFDVSKEPKSLKEKLSEDLRSKQKFKLKILTLAIEPEGVFSLPDRPCFWFYLIKIFE